MKEMMWWGGQGDQRVEALGVRGQQAGWLEHERDRKVLQSDCTEPPWTARGVIRVHLKVCHGLCPIKQEFFDFPCEEESNINSKQSVPSSDTEVCILSIYSELTVSLLKFWDCHGILKSTHSFTIHVASTSTDKISSWNLNDVH